jgi:hypothetical protein
MKIVALLVLVLFSFTPIQDPRLPRNEAGKISIEEEVAVEGMNKEALFRNALTYSLRVQKVSDRSQNATASVQQGLVKKGGSFYVYKKGLFTPQIHGEISYRLQLQVSDEGFTYTFTDFVFHYYGKNRYGQYQPLSGKTKALEEEKFAGMQELWEAHKSTTRRHIDQHIATLKTSMVEIPAGVQLQEGDRRQEQY